MSTGLLQLAPTSAPVEPLDILILGDWMLEVYADDPDIREWAWQLFLDRSTELPSYGRPTMSREVIKWEAYADRIRAKRLDLFGQIFDLYRWVSVPAIPIQEVADYLRAAWDREIAPLATAVPAAVAPVAVLEIKSGMKTVAEMADLMDLDRDELQRRLDSREWDYKFKVYSYYEKDSTGHRLDLARNDYSFGKKEAEWNVKNRDKKREIKTR